MEITSVPTIEMRSRKMSRYVGIGPEKGKQIETEFALGYALQRIMQNEEEQKEFVEWYFSGNWTRESEE